MFWADGSLGLVEQLVSKENLWIQNLRTVIQETLWHIGVLFFYYQIIQKVLHRPSPLYVLVVYLFIFWTDLFRPSYVKIDWRVHHICTCVCAYIYINTHTHTGSCPFIFFYANLDYISSIQMMNEWQVH